MIKLVDSITGESHELEEGQTLHHKQFGTVTLKDFNHTFERGKVIIEGCPNNFIKVFVDDTNDVKSFQPDALGKWLFLPPEEMSFPEKELKSFKEDLRVMQEELIALEKEFQIKHEDVSSLENKSAETEKRIKKLQEDLDGLKSTKSPKELKENQSKIAEIEQNISPLKNDLDECNKELKKARDNKKQLSETIKTLLQDKDRIEGQISLLTSKKD